MRDDLLTPLEQISTAAEHLLADTDLSFEQEQIVQSVHHVAREMVELVVSIPDLTWDKAREVFSFESRSHLASIIGYAEVLLDDSKLDSQQVEYVKQVQSSGKHVLSRLASLEN